MPHPTVTILQSYSVHSFQCLNHPIGICYFPVIPHWDFICTLRKGPSGHLTRSLANRVMGPQFLLLGRLRQDNQIQGQSECAQDQPCVFRRPSVEIKTTKSWLRWLCKKRHLPSAWPPEFNPWHLRENWYSKLSSDLHMCTDKQYTHTHTFKSTKMAGGIANWQGS